MTLPGVLPARFTDLIVGLATCQLHRSGLSSGLTVEEMFLHCKLSVMFHGKGTSWYIYLPARFIWFKMSSHFEAKVGGIFQQALAFFFASSPRFFFTDFLSREMSDEK